MIEHSQHLEISKSHVGDFFVGNTGNYTIQVSNRGLEPEGDVVMVTDTLPPGLSFAGSSGTDWSCAAIGQDITCTNPAGIPAAGSLPDLTRSVIADATAVPSVINTAAVNSGSTDANPANDSSSDPTNVNGPRLVLTKTTQVVSDPLNGTTNPKNIPGAIVEYTVTISNEGPGSVDSGSLAITDVVPARTRL